MIALYNSYLAMLKPFCAEEEKEEGQKQNIPPQQLSECFQRLSEAVDNLDMDEMEAVIEKMKEYHYEGEQQEIFGRLKEAVEEVDVEACVELMQKWPR